MANHKSYEVVLMNFAKAGFHFSSGKEDNYDRSLQRIHSDTLKSALFATIIRLYGDEFLEDNGKDSFFNAFRISSAFPFWIDQQGKHHYFLPKPALPPEVLFKNVQGFKEEEVHKKLSKVSYIEAEFLRSILKDNQVITADDISRDGKFLIQQHSFQEKLFHAKVKQQVQIAKDGNEDSLPFGIDKVYFTQESGLYVLIEATEEGFTEQLKAAWRLLGEEGIGTDRTTGNGSFTPDFVSGAFSWPVSDTADWQTNLSLYWPEQQEASVMTDATYQLVRRGGFIAQPADNNHISIRKRSVYMMTEGSVFPANATLEGRLGDLKPADKPLVEAGIAPVDHPVWRDGRPIFLPL